MTLFKYTLTVLCITLFSLAFGQEDTTRTTEKVPPVFNANKNTKKDSIKILDFPEVEPQFPGGSKAMYEFIARNVHYPMIAIEANQQGKVYVQFVVERDGSLSQIKVMKGKYESLNKEAIRVVKKMPKWIPGNVNNKKVRCMFRLPINFQLQ